MGVAIDFLGYRYDDAVPAFIILAAPPHPLRPGSAPKFLYHRGSKRVIEWIYLELLMLQAGYVRGANEIGDDVDNWLYLHTEFGTFTAPPAPGAIVITPGGLGTGTLTLTPTVPLPPAVAGRTATVGLTVDGVAVNATIDAPTPADATEEDIADALAAVLDGTQDKDGNATISATSANGVVTLTQTGSLGAGNFDGTPTFPFHALQDPDTYGPITVEGLGTDTITLTFADNATSFGRLRFFFTWQFTDVTTDPAQSFSIIFSDDTADGAAGQALIRLTADTAGAQLDAVQNGNVITITGKNSEVFYDAYYKMIEVPRVAEADDDPAGRHGAWHKGG